MGACLITCADIDGGALLCVQGCCLDGITQVIAPDRDATDRTESTSGLCESALLLVRLTFEIMNLQLAIKKFKLGKCRGVNDIFLTDTKTKYGKDMNLVRKHRRGNAALISKVSL